KVALGHLALRAGKHRFGLWADEGKLPDQMTAARQRLQDRFTQADANGDGALVAQELVDRSYNELRLVLTGGDRDGDGKLTPKELAGWLDLQQQIARGHVLLTVLDHGAGLFELLDADRDGSLSVPELRASWDRVKTAGCIRTDGQFDRGALSYQ